MLLGLLLGTPNGAKKHDRLVIVLQVAAFVTVNIYDIGHTLHLKSFFFSYSSFLRCKEIYCAEG